VTVKGHENIPDSGGIIICANHIHWLDPLLLGVVIKRRISFMAKAELFQNKIFAAVLKSIHAFPVKRGTADISAIKNSLKIVKEGGALGIFPEGTRSKDGKIHEAEPGVALIAVKAKALVVPVKISGSYKHFSSIKVIIGEPIMLGDNQKQKISLDKINELSQSIMNQIARLN